MTPDFALKLSEDHIVLLQRSLEQKGWQEKGTVSTESEQLDFELNTLSEKVISLGGNNSCVKIILPHNQLFFTQVSVPNVSEIEVQYALEKQDSLTDYLQSMSISQDSSFDETTRKVESLSYAVSGDPPNVSIIAVSKELLHEVERFFKQFQFKIAGFTTIPPIGLFGTEPNLGSNILPPTYQFKPDNEIVKIIKIDNTTLELPSQKSHLLSPHISEENIIKDALNESPSLNTVNQETFQSKNPLELNLGSFKPFSELDERNAADFRKRIKRFLLVVLLIILGPIAFISIYFLSEFIISNNRNEGVDNQENTLSQSTTKEFGSGEKTTGKRVDAKLSQPQKFDKKIAQELYKKNGIWQLSPLLEATKNIENKYHSFNPAIDKVPIFSDAPSISMDKSVYPEVPFRAPLSPISPETKFALNAQGLVNPSIEGTLNSDGIMIYLGTTPVPARKRPFEQSLKQKEESKNDLKLNKPRLRPYSMVELQERIKSGQFSDLKLITQMPGKRTGLLEQKILDVIKENINKTSVAVVSRARPNGVSSKTVIKASVDKNSINLKQITLIGTSGRTTKVKALIRFPNGTIETIRLGDYLDGGRVVSINSKELRYKKNGKTIALKIPKS